MKLWPFVSRRVHELELAHRDALLAERTEERNYYKVRTERLTDAALVRAGAVNGPTFVDPGARKDQNMLSLITSSLAITEIDSRVKKGA